MKGMRATGYRLPATVGDMPNVPSTPDTLAGIGESAVLARIFPRLPAASAQLLGPGDDAAVVAAPDGRFVVTTDLMVEGPDFRLEWSTAHDLGWKAAASNLADVAAMGAVPTALVVALAAPSGSPVSLLEGIADGVRDACETLAPGCGVVGGDLSVSPTLTIAITAFGDLEGRPPVLRSGARQGDVIAVAGPLGVSAAALALLFSEGVDELGMPDAARATALRHRTEGQLAPRPPIAAGRTAANAQATAMLDLSDGLAIDAGRMAAASGIRIDFDSALLGSDPALALAGGEDHSLLAAFPVDAALPPEFRRIGACRAGVGISLDGQPQDLAGWDPYRDWSARPRG